VAASASNARSNALGRWIGAARSSLQVPSIYLSGLLGVALALRLVANPRDLLSDVLAAACVAALAWRAYAELDRPSAVRRLGVIAIGCAACMLVGSIPLVARPLVLSAAFASLSQLLPGPSASRRALAALARGLACWSVVWFVLHVVPDGFLAAQAWSHLVSRLSERVPGSGVHLGATVAGVEIVALFWMVAMSSGSGSALRRSLVAALAGLCFQSAFVIAVLPTLRFLHRDVGVQGLVLADLNWLLVIALALWLSAAQARWPAPASPEPRGLQGIFPAAIGLLACLAAVPWPIAEPLKQSPPRVVVHDPGYLDRRTPATDPTAYGGSGSGMFGFLEGWAAVCGFELRRADVADEFDFQSTDVVVLINLIERLPNKARVRLQEFVERGGGLLVLADHTGLDAIRGPSNDVVGRWGIEVNFDSAVALRRSWADGIEVLMHGATLGAKNQEQLQIWTGASLRVNRPARAIVIGKHAFADRGNAANNQRGHLGDMHHQPGEHLGGLVLVAAAEPADGRVLVFGDTSTFQNLALGRSRPFAAQCIRWLAHCDRVAWSSTMRELAAWIAVLAAVIAAWCGSRLGAPAAYILAAAPLGSLLACGERRWTPSERSEAAPIAHIDISHAPRATRVGWFGDGWAGIQHALFRAGLRPFAPEEFRRDLLAEASALVMLAPTRTYDNDEVAMLVEWIEGGGLAMLTLGHPHADQQRELLRAFSLEVGSMPLGSVESETELGRMRCYNAYPTLSHPATAKVIVGAADLPVMTWIPRGAGGLLFVSDSEFLLNKNLEDDEQVVAENAQFVVALIQSLRERRVAR
jgi:hypothetical protein